MCLRPKQPVRERFSEVVLDPFQVNSHAMRKRFDPEIDPAAGSEASMECVVGFLSLQTVSQNHPAVVMCAGFSVKHK